MWISDGEIELTECVDLLEERADKFGLTRDSIYKKVVHFYNMADKDGDKKITLIEFFVSLPNLEDFLLNERLQ